MCNHYRFKYPRETIFKLVDAARDLNGDAPFRTDVFYNSKGPIVRLVEGKCIIDDAKWSLPSPCFTQKTQTKDVGIFDTTDPMLGYWRKWLGLSHRCLVPVSSFAEPDLGSKDEAWFAFEGREPPSFFAGIFLSRQHSACKLDDLDEPETNDSLFGILSTSPNAEVRALHAETMPIMLTTASEWHKWLTADWQEAKDLLRPLPNGSLKLIDHTPYGRAKCA